jgi:cysteinyl-tRNA synthetase
MSLKYLGETIDIHGGGQDLVFPHHENEITQSESFTGKKPFVKYWMHNGSLQLGAEKMSKSLGNLITIRDALKKYSADAIHIFVLSSYYRSPLTYTEEALEAAQSGADRLQRAASRYEASGTGKPLDAEPYKRKFMEAMDDDFNTAQAIAILFDLAREINQAADAGVIVNNAQNTLISLARGVLGLKIPRNIRVQSTVSIGLKATAKVTVIPGTVNARVTRLIEERVNCRKEKKWQRADEIRKKLEELGVTLEDIKAKTDATFKLVPSEESLENLMKELGIDF